MMRGFIKIKHEQPQSWYMCINCGYTMRGNSEHMICPICNNEQQPPELAQTLIQARKAPF